MSDKKNQNNYIGKNKVIKEIKAFEWERINKRSRKVNL
jgi:hypothetical protein